MSCFSSGTMGPWPADTQMINHIRNQDKVVQHGEGSGSSYNSLPVSKKGSYLKNGEVLLSAGPVLTGQGSVFTGQG